MMFTFLKTGKEMELRRYLKAICNILFLKKQKRSDAKGAHSCRHTPAVWEVVTILTKELKFYLVQCAGGRFFKENSWKTLSLNNL